LTLPSIKTYIVAGTDSLIFIKLNTDIAGSSGRAVEGLRLRPLACWNCGFEFHCGHGCLSVVSITRCQVEVSAKSWSLVQRSPTNCGASLCEI
jgi:predicted Zn-ribbon and HTH transcriptional regulator